MKTLNLMIDMDAIVADLATPWHDLWNKDHPERPVTAELANNWDLGKAIGDSRIYAYLKTPGLYKRLPVIPGAKKGIKEIIAMRNKDGSKKFKPFFLTASITAPWILTDKAEWAQKEFPEIPPKQMIMAYHKELVRGDVFIDDSPKNLKRIREAQGSAMDGGPILITIDYPYNKDVDDVIQYRAFGWNDLPNAWENIVTYLRAVQPEPEQG